jgi:ubiquinone/menaquinone biosynthesis C-methylase UbiE
LGRLSQKDVFVASEGDHFYERNKPALLASETALEDPVLSSLRALELQPKTVLEIGCSNGWRLDACQRLFDAKCYGIDPSAKAIADGSDAYEEISLQQGTADQLGFEDGMFDLVICGFCLYLCDRADLFRISSEADRVLADKGHLAIFDFDPPFPYRNTYKYQPGLYSYKMDHARMFLWNPVYTLLSRKMLTHSGLAAIDNPDERLSIMVLRKNSEAAYPTDPFCVMSLSEINQESTG